MELGTKQSSVHEKTSLVRLEWRRTQQNLHESRRSHTLMPCYATFASGCFFAEPSVERKRWICGFLFGQQILTFIARMMIIDTSCLRQLEAISMIAEIHCFTIIFLKDQFGRFFHHFQVHRYSSYVTKKIPWTHHDLMDLKHQTDGCDELRFSLPSYLSDLLAILGCDDVQVQAAAEQAVTEVI